MDTPALERLATLIRYRIISMTGKAGSGHLTSSLSAVEAMTALFFRWFRYDLANPGNPVNDRLIFSKGHPSPLLYALYAAAGAVDDTELAGYRTFGSRLEGHPTPRFRYTDAATGSLGQGLSVAMGEAFAMRWMAHGDIHEPLGSTRPHIWVLMGDGELSEGSVWEAIALASRYTLSNITAVIDMNGLGQSTPTMMGHDMHALRKRLEAFGWGVIAVNGHDFGELNSAYEKVLDYKAGPTAIIADTVKGKGIADLEGKVEWHGRVLTGDALTTALQSLGHIDMTGGQVTPPDGISVGTGSPDVADNPPSMQTYGPEGKTATRKAFGNALVRLGHIYPELVVLDGDMQNSTFTQLFAEAFPARFLEGYIAEQTIAGAAIGLSARGLKPVVSTFASFLTRAADQIRMAGVSQADILFNGSHAGVSIGEDGPSQMGLEDLSLFRTVPRSTVLYPADAVAAERLTELAVAIPGIRYVRTARMDTPHVYGADEPFRIGGSHVFHGSGVETVTVVAAGVTLHEALAAQQALARDGIVVRVIDCYSIKPIDAATLVSAVRDTKGMVVVEDHYAEGGLGEAVLAAIAGTGRLPFVHLADRKLPMSGSPRDLFAYEGIDRDAIVKAVRGLA